MTTTTYQEIGDPMGKGKLVMLTNNETQKSYPKYPSHPVNSFLKAAPGQPQANCFRYKKLH
jgi:hypothetical protein